jgi:hypothetical protein
LYNATVSYSFQVIFIISLVKFKPLGDETDDYPDWADAVGWCLGCLSMAQIPFWAIVNIFQQKGSSLKDVSIYLAISDNEPFRVFS